jgi:hypothetical protein
MEAHENGSKEKAEKICKMYEKKFKAIIFTIHQLREYELKGKPSNVSWCAEHLE